MIKTQYIPDLVGALVAKVDQTLSTRDTNPFHVYYDFGHHQEVQKNLIEKEGNPSKPAKYPLVWLVTPFKEVSYQNKYAKCDLHFVIVNDTSQQYTMRERRDLVFLPILYPVLAELLNQVEKSPRFSFVPPMKYEKMDLQYARVDSSGTNLLNDFVDVIDLKLSDILIHNIC